MNDPKSFYDKYKSLVYNLALKYSTNKEDAEEITQDVFLSVFKKMSSFRNKLLNNSVFSTLLIFAN